MIVILRSTYKGQIIQDEVVSVKGRKITKDWWPIGWLIKLFKPSLPIHSYPDGVEGRVRLSSDMHNKSITLSESRFQ